MAGTLPVPRTHDWSGLPPELLQIIARKLPDISDFVNFRAVCTTWRSSALVSNPPPQLPWFLQRRDSLQGDLSFYSLFSGKIHTVSSPNSSGNWFKGPAHDYILLYNATSYEISLLNPITDRKVVLPFLDIAGPCPVRIGPDPIHSEECVVLSGNSSDFKTGILALYQPVERDWVVIEECSLHNRDAYYNGMYFVNEEETGTTKVIDVVTRKVVHMVPPPPPPEDDNDCHHSPRGMTYLVQSAGDILRVFLHDDELLQVKDSHFHIHRLDFGSENGGKPCWVKISSIGDHILFLDQDSGFSLSCKDFSGIRGNSIYFLKLQSQDIYEPPFYFLCRYDIEEARTEPLACPLANGGTWIVPSLR